MRSGASFSSGSRAYRNTWANPSSSASATRRPCSDRKSLPMPSRGLRRVCQIGGRLTGRGEAAALTTPYIEGNGAKLNIDPSVYQTSVIVKDASAAIKDYVRTLFARNASFAAVSSKDRAFMLSAHGKRLMRAAGRNMRSQGWLLGDGYLLVEQNNARLQKANNRFVLASQNASLTTNSFVTRWSVDDLYEFEPFDGPHGSLRRTARGRSLMCAVSRKPRPSQMTTTTTRRGCYVR